MGNHLHLEQTSIGRRFFLQFLLGLGFAAFTGCRGANLGDDARPLVVSTNTILTDLTQRLAQDTIRLVSILKPGDDPHVYEPVPRDTQAIEQADLIVYNGYNLEPALIRLIQAGNTRGRSLAVGEVVPPLQLAEKGQRVPDPHVWGHVQNVIPMVRAIAKALVALLPTAEAHFETQATALIQELQRLDQWIHAQIQTIPPAQRKLVTTHDAFQYYGQAYGLELVGTLIGISTEEQPSAQTVQRLVVAIKQAQVPAIFAETTINPALIQTVAQEAGVRLAPQELYSDSIGNIGSGADSYVTMMVANTTAIATALGGTVKPFALAQS